MRTVSDYGHVALVVSDNGAGVPVEDMERIMEPLYSTKVYGVGLGLPTVKKIVEKHGGEFTFEPNEGGGTRASIGLKTVQFSHDESLIEAVP